MSILQTRHALVQCLVTVLEGGAGRVASSCSVGLGRAAVRLCGAAVRSWGALARLAHPGLRADVTLAGKAFDLSTSREDGLLAVHRDITGARVVGAAISGTAVLATASAIAAPDETQETPDAQQLMVRHVVPPPSRLATLPRRDSAAGRRCMHMASQWPTLKASQPTWHSVVPGPRRARLSGRWRPSLPS